MPLIQDLAFAYRPIHRCRAPISALFEFGCRVQEDVHVYRQSVYRFHKPQQFSRPIGNIVLDNQNIEIGFLVGLVPRVGAEYDDFARGVGHRRDSVDGIPYGLFA